MSTFTQIYYHLVFGTKNREPVLMPGDKRADLYRYIWGIVKNKQSHLYRINGMADHVHLLVNLHPSIALADLVKDIKLGSSAWIKSNGVFPEFTHWQEGYGAFTVSHDKREAVIGYIANQEEHHKEVSFLDEFKALLKAAGIQYDERYVP